MALGGGLALLTWLAVTRAGAAPPSDPIRVELDAPAGCPDVDAFYASVLARAEHARRADATEEAVRLIVRLARAGAGFHGELRLVDPRGVTDLRRVDGATCEEVAEALSLTAALALGPSARAAARATAVASSSSEPTGAPSSSPSASVAGVAPSPAATAPPPSSTASSSTEATPTTPRASPPSNDLASPPPVIESEAPSARARRGFGLGTEARAMAANVVSPDVSLGGAFEVALTRRKAVDAVEPAVGLALLVLRDDLLKSPGQVAVHLTAAVLTICPGLGVRAVVTIQVCAQGIGGWLTATERDVTNPRSAGRPWWSAGGVARATVALGAGFALRLDAGISAPLVKRRFVTSTPEEIVGQSPLVSIMGGIGVGYEL